MGKFDGRKGSKKKLAWTSEAEDAFSRLKERLLGQLGLFLVDPNKGFVLRTDASDYAVGAVLEQVRDDGWRSGAESWPRANVEPGPRGRRRHTPLFVRSGSGLATSDYNRWWFVRTISPHRARTHRHVDTPAGPAARRARWHETFPKFNLSVVYVPGKDNTVAYCLSRWAYPAGKAWMDISSHGDAE